MVKIALTGVTGAMGGEVLNSLIASPKNFEIKCIIYEEEKHVPKFVKKLIKKGGKRVTCFNGNIARYEDCEKLIEGCNYLINCASIIPPKSDHDPKGTYLSNFVGTKNLVDAVLKSGRADEIGFVHVATVAMYGNRSYPHVWGRVGDPIISSDYDYYSLYKLKAERYLLESGLKKFVSLRQTGVLHKYMFANNLKDGLMFHTSWNCVLEWVTDVDSGRLCSNLVERDLNGKLEGFWNRVYNIGGGRECRVTGYETLDAGFSLMGRTAKKFFKPNWNIPRNFHGVWFYDSRDLEEYVPFRSESFDDYWKRMGKKYGWFKLAKIVPAPVITKLVFKRLFKNTNAPMYWIKHNKHGRIKAFYGGKDKFEAIGSDWTKYRLLCEGKTATGEIDYEALKSKAYAKEYGLLLDHGYDESKPLVKLEFEDLQQAAEFRGGKCLSTDYKAGGVYGKVKWQCRDGHEFSSSPYTILKGGYWCPECCEPKPWRYGALAKDIPFYAQVYYDTHDKNEENDVYPLNDEEDEFIIIKK
ncbi:MAG: NAD-dependent epimerase/dehydratase family protein [Clostridia bacterium]|nr:NAD-dependent epimerase/dehydratase family protein [Clostridia bacterium]